MAKQSSRGTEWNRLRLQILERDHNQCAYCGAEADTVDHIIAKNNGGEDIPSNLVAACRRCNGLKSDKPLIRLNYFNRAWLSRL